MGRRRCGGRHLLRRIRALHRDSRDGVVRAAGIPYGKVFERFDCWLPRASYRMEFRRPAVLDEQLSVRASVARIGASSIALKFAFDNVAGERVADCDIVLVCVDRKTFKPKPVPAEMRDALSAFCDAA